jgi:hypothetical protein
MAVGLALSYFVPKWFKTDDADQVDSRAVYESLAKRVAESHKTIIQLATTIPSIEQHFQHSMDSVFDDFMVKYNKLGNQTADLMNSMRTGELRMTLIAANTVQEMNRFSQFFLYSQVINACTNNQLSLLAVNQSSLAGELTQLKKNLDSVGFEFLFGLKDLSPYHTITGAVYCCPCRWKFRNRGNFRLVDGSHQTATSILLIDRRIHSSFLRSNCNRSSTMLHPF